LFTLLHLIAHHRGWLPRSHFSRQWNLFLRALPLEKLLCGWFAAGRPNFVDIEMVLFRTADHNPASGAVMISAGPILPQGAPGPRKRWSHQHVAAPAPFYTAGTIRIRISGHDIDLTGTVKQYAGECIDHEGRVAAQLDEIALSGQASFQTRAALPSRGMLSFPMEGASSPWTSPYRCGHG
jgi:hypothetical protein